MSMYYAETLMQNIKKTKNTNKHDYLWQVLWEQHKDLSMYPLFSSLVIKYVM